MNTLQTNTPGLPQQKPFIILIALAALSLLVTLTLPYIREEGVYTISTLEMFYHHQLFSSSLFDIPYPRPPIYNWMISGFSYLLGWHNILIASRLATALSTLLLAVTVGWFTQRLFAQRSFSLLCVVAFLSGDVLLMRGWLAYTDTTFGLFIFAAIAFLWLGLNEQKKSFIFWAALSISGAFLTKHFSAYVFYAVAAACLLYRHPNRLFLLKPFSIITHSLAMLIPLLWFYAANQDHGQDMLHNITAAFQALSLHGYVKHLLTHPFDIIRHFAPLSIIAIYYLARGNIVFNKSANAAMTTLALMTFVNFLPYYLAPSGGSARYILPLYPFIAILFAYPIWCAGQKALKITLIALSAFLVVKILLCGLWLPYQLAPLKRQYQQSTQDLLKRTQGYPVYIYDYNFEELGIVSLYDIAHFGKKIIAEPSSPNWTDGFIIAAGQKNNAFGQVITQYKVNKFRYIKHTPTTLYLYCRGKACHT